MMSMHEVEISHVDLSARRIQRKKDFVAEESPLHVFVNGTRYVTILCSPRQLKELAVGHILSEGVVKSVDEIRDILLDSGGKCQILLKAGIDAEKRISISQPFARLVISACGSQVSWPLSRLVDRMEFPKVTSDLTVDATIVLDSVRQLNTLAKTFRMTGGVHIAALFSLKGKVLTSAEDVGRHNAVDKVIGTAGLNKVDFANCFLAISGRLTGDIVLKAARMGIPLIASLAAAIDSGIEVAQLTGVTLSGFVRGKRINIYTHPERIVIGMS